MKMIGWIGMLAAMLLLAPAGNAQAAKPQILDKSVRFVYLVSADRQERADYKAAIEMAALNIQAWYKKQLGTTFKLNPQVVEVAHSREKAAWFYANPNGDDRDVWGYNNTFDEVQRLLGTEKNDPDHIWVIYSDGPGNSGRGGSGVCIMPEDDLLGLIGQHPEQKDINRWIAGLGHEIGHAFGLSHPQDTEKDADAIMWTGIYGKYPDQCYLTGEDVEILSRSPFFFNDEGVSNEVIFETLAVYSYDEGTFSKTMNPKNGDVVWVEEKTDGSETYEFYEADFDDSNVYLQSVDRDLRIRLPLSGGNAEVTVDGGAHWYSFRKMKLEE